jgi:hypothetical protein
LTSPTIWKCWIPPRANTEPETALQIFLCESALKDPCAKCKMARFHDIMQDIDGLTYPFNCLFLHTFVPERSPCQIS